MINIRAEQKIQGVDLESIKESIESFQTKTDQELTKHEQRIQSLERWSE